LDVETLAVDVAVPERSDGTAREKGEEEDDEAAGDDVYENNVGVGPELFRREELEVEENDGDFDQPENDNISGRRYVD
jgi:hypothetical protein